jgi:phage terminase large subunit
VAAGISAVRQLLPQCWFDETKCAAGLGALERYAEKWSPELQMFSMKLEHSKWSHAADAFRTFAVGLSELPVDDDNWKPSETITRFNGSSHRQR